MNLDKLITNVLIGLMLLVAAIGVYGVIDDSRRSEDCRKASGTMINTPKGTLCVLNLEKLTTKPTQQN